MLDAGKDEGHDKEAERDKDMEQRRRDDNSNLQKGRKDQKKHLEPTLTWIAEDDKYAFLHRCICVKLTGFGMG